MILHSIYDFSLIYRLWESQVQYLYFQKKKNTKTLKANVGDQALPTFNIDNANLENPCTNFKKLKSIKFNITSLACHARLHPQIWDYQS